MMIKKILLAIVLLLLAPCALAADSAANKLQQQLDAINTLQADFTQIVYNENGQVAQQVHGKLDVKRPGEFRWDVKQPTPQLIITRGDKVWVYDPGLEQVTIRRLDSRISQAPLLLLTSHPDLEKNFIVNQQGDSYTLMPKKGQSQDLHQVTITFNHGVVTSLWLETDLGHRMLLNLSHVYINQPIADSLFHFVAPKGIEVLNQYDSANAKTSS